MKIDRIENHLVPYDLLYLADEDDNRIAVYRDSAVFFASYDAAGITGIIGVKELDSSKIEIVAVAVYEQHQNKKIGTGLIEEAISYSKKNSYSEITVKTGNCGLGQLYLYQSCGFRFKSVNRDYFTRYYKAPIYENNIQCIDQIVLTYRIYTEAELKNIIIEYWTRFAEQKPEYGQRGYEAWNFCYGEYLPNKLLGLVRSGKKTGTSSALELYKAGEKIPEPGDLSIITFGNGLPGCIIETKETRIKKFREITGEEARLEGEGDLSLEFWRRAHEWFFKLEYGQAGKEFSEDIPVLFECFDVIYDEDRK